MIAHYNVAEGMVYFVKYLILLNCIILIEYLLMIIALIHSATSKMNEIYLRRRDTSLILLIVIFVESIHLVNFYIWKMALLFVTCTSLCRIKFHQEFSNICFHLFPGFRCRTGFHCRWFSTKNKEKWNWHDTDNETISYILYTTAFARRVCDIVSIFRPIRENPIFSLLVS